MCSALLSVLCGGGVIMPFNLPREVFLQSNWKEWETIKVQFSENKIRLTLEKQVKSSNQNQDNV